MRGVVHGTKEEPSARTVTGEPVRWTRHFRWRIWDSDEGWYWFNELHGVTWSCPKCEQRPDTVVLRERKPNQYWFKCRNWKCRWSEPFNAISGRDLVIGLGETPPSAAPSMPIDIDLDKLRREHPELADKHPGLFPDGSDPDQTPT